MRNKYSIELIADIKSKVNLFKSNKDLSEAVGLPEKALSDLMYRNRIFREGNNRGKSFNINHNAFEHHTPESDYWAGFIASDGCITDEKTLQINLQPSDIIHLNKLSQFLNSDAKPRLYNTSSRYSVTSAKIVIDLKRNYNIVRNKSKVYETDYISKQFLLGYFDGDGILTAYRERGCNIIRCGIIGSYAFIDHLSAKLSGFKHGVSKRENIKIIHFGQLTSLAFLTWLYQGSSTFLERKKSLFLLALSKLSDKQRYNYLKRIETLQTTVVFWQDI